jgi:hypothetical protein
MIVIDNRELHANARRSYEQFKKTYKLIKMFEREEFVPDKVTMSMLELFIREAFEIEPELRKNLAGLEELNSQLAEMIKKGYLKLKEDETWPGLKSLILSLQR